MSRYILHILMIISLVMLLGCSSGGGIPTDPGIENPDFRASEVEGSHFLMGLYDINIDPFTWTVEAFPSRQAYPHYDVTDYLTPPDCTDCIKIKVTHIDSVNHVLTLDITIKNPTSYSGFDVRGILLLNEFGHELINPDGWVSIKDDLEPPYFNPFMRYGKDDPDGKFPGNTSLMETYTLQLPTPPQYSQIKYLVEAFRPKNGFREPYAIIDKQVIGFLFADGSNTVTLQLHVLDRNDDVLGVTVSCPPMWHGVVDMVLDGDLWTAELTNTDLAPAQTEAYTLVIEAIDTVSSYTLRDEHPVFVIEQTLGWEPTFTQQEMGACSIDIAGANIGLTGSGGYLVDSMSQCTGFSAYDLTFTMPISGFSLTEMSSNNPSLTPYPPVRFDSAGLGAICFSNSSDGTFVNGIYLSPMKQVVVSLDDSLFFQDDGFGDHQAHHPFYADSLQVADVCDGFENRFYMLWASDSGENAPLVRCYEASYTTKNQVIGAYFPAEFVGEGPGKIMNDASVLRGIDAREVEEAPDPIENVELYILENAGDYSELEVFNIFTDNSTGMSTITYVNTVTLPAEMGEARDLELLPVNPEYEFNPDRASLAIMFRREILGEVAGYIEIFDTLTLATIDQIGNTGEPSVFDEPRHLDVHDNSFSVLATSESAVGIGSAKIFTFTYG